MKKILLLAVVSAFSYVSYGQALYRHIVQSEGNYELEGKKFFIQDLIDNSSSVGNSSVSFDDYLRQSLVMRGAVSVLDSLDADFIVRSSIKYGKRSEDVSFASNGSRHSGGKGARADSWKMFRDTIPSDPVERDKRYMDKGISGAKAKHFEVFNKTISIELFDSKSKNLIGKTEIYSYNFGKGFGALSPNEAMLFIAADSYGKTGREIIILNNDNDYFELFKKNSISEAKNLRYAPNSEFSSEGVKLFLVDRRPDKTIVIVKDDGKMRINTNKKQTAFIKFGDSFLPCSNMTYNTDNWHVTRLLTIEFPSIEENDKTIDLLFCKSGNPDKVKYSICGISL